MGPNRVFVHIFLFLCGSRIHGWDDLCHWRECGDARLGVRPSAAYQSSGKKASFSPVFSVRSPPSGRVGKEPLPCSPSRPLAACCCRKVLRTLLPAPMSRFTGFTEFLASTRSRRRIFGGLCLVFEVVMVLVCISFMRCREMEVRR